MVDTKAAPRPAGYFQQYLARMAPTPLPPAPLPFPAASPRTPLPAPIPSGRRVPRNGAPGKARPRKSLVDAFQQHGMRLCDGAKLNVVAKGVTHLGAVPPTLGVHVTALYLSQNELRSLDGIEQFTSVRLLSVAANRIVRFADVERLQALRHLRHVNLVGNPVCDHPNYRFRVLDALRSLAVLDAVDVSKNERELAPLIASQDRALRGMVMKNHIEIQKLQRISAWIAVLGELRCGVLRDAVTGRFDQLPTTHGEGVLDIDRLVRVWCYEDTLTSAERDTLEAHMMAIVARTRSKLTEETPQTKAKEMLFKLANAAALRRGALSELPPAMRREHCGWEDAYAHVLQLQQQTIANLRSECDRNRQTVMDSMRELMVVNPAKRRALAMRGESSSRRRPTIVQNQRMLSPCRRDAATATTPREHEEEGRDQIVMVSSADEKLEDPTTPGPDQSRALVPNPPASNHELMSERSNTVVRSNQRSLRQVLRSGQFGNKTLNEAIQSFSLRQPQETKPCAGRRGIRPATTFIHTHASKACPARESNHSLHVATHDSRIVASKKLILNNDHMQQSELSTVLDSIQVAGTETVCSADTTFAPSTSGFFSDCYSDHDSLSSTPILVTSRVQIDRPQDKLLHYREAQPLELNTVHEDFSSHTSINDEEMQPQHSKDSRVAIPRFLNERQHELEAREEKYIAALMDSEQRELDLRQQINVMNTQLARFQQLLSDNEAERHRIKLEIHHRVSAVARPTMLRRFFVKWCHYYRWSLQVRHIHRKRKFITQHDAFWCWRRQVWARQQVKRIQRRQHARLLRSHMVEWANVTRITVIAFHTQALRQSQLIKRVFHEWRQQAHVRKLTRCMLECRGQDASQHRLQATLTAWRRAVTQARQLRHLQSFYARGAVRALKLATIRRWKFYVLGIARPQRLEVTKFVAASTLLRKKDHFSAWRSVIKSGRRYRSHLQLKVWRAWWSTIQAHAKERDHAISARVDILKRSFVEWHHAASDRAVCRRSLTMATRHVNHRRLRKLWMYWKIYSMGRKRYMQGSSKALKHYYKKLLRRTWTHWKQDTRENLVTLRAKKRGELSFHFNAFREGVRKRIETKKRQKFVSYACKRRQLSQLRQTFKAWALCSRRRKRCKSLHQYLTGSRSRSALSFAWLHWRSRRMLLLQSKLFETNRQRQIAAEEKMEAERELGILNDRSLSLAEQVRRLTSKVRAQAKDIQIYQDEMNQRELQIGELEGDVKQAMLALREADDNRQEETSREQMAHKATVRRLEDENHALKTKITENEGTIANLTRSLDEAKEETSRMRALSLEAQRQNDEIKRCSKECEHSLRETLKNLEMRLQEEQAEKEETVRRLQEYEARIASTCAEISEHENAHEQERLKLREENARLEVLQKEGAARTAELERLLGEKNEQIIVLSSNLKDTLRHGDLEASLRRPGIEEHGQDDKGSVRKSSKVLSKSHCEHSVDDAAGSDVPQSPSLAASFVCVPVKSVHHCVIVGDEGYQAQSEVDAVKHLASLNPVPAFPSEEERVLDERTSRIHADIQLLQERITRRLQQVPCVPTIEHLALKGGFDEKTELGSDAGSVSTVSESEHERERKILRKLSSAATRIKSGACSTRANVPAQQKRTKPTPTARENSSGLANRSTPQSKRIPIAQKHRAEPNVPRRPLTACDTSKTKKRSSVKTATKSSTATDS